MKRLMATSPIDIMMTTSGRTFIPGVSSSKNLSRPALAAGIGASRLRLFSRLVDNSGHYMRLTTARAIKLWFFCTPCQFVD
jgi:hypothetical protein